MVKKSKGQMPQTAKRIKTFYQSTSSCREDGTRCEYEKSIGRKNFSLGQKRASKKNKSNSEIDKIQGKYIIYFINKPLLN